MSDDDKTIVFKDDGTTTHINSLAQQNLKPRMVLMNRPPLGKVYLIEKDIAIIGRVPELCDIVLQDPSVSKKHARLVAGDDGIKVEDLGSTNKTFVNDKEVKAKVLEEHDLVRCGKVVLKFISKFNIVEAQYHKEQFDVSNMDPLTRVFNRKYFVEALKQEFNRAQAKGDRHLSLLMFDIDHFKQINDKHGHPAGDYVLQTLCSILDKKVTREEDIFARVGGEEFCILLPTATAQAAQAIAERIRKTVEQFNFVHEGSKIPVTISVGVATYIATIKTPDDFYKKADQALYRSKEGGRNKVTVA